MSVYKL